MSASDVWFADVDQMWLEFIVPGIYGTSERSSRRRTVPLVDNFPLMAWMSRVTPVADNPGPKTAADPALQPPAQNFCAIARVGTKDIKAQV